MIFIEILQEKYTFQQTFVLFFRMHSSLELKLVIILTCNMFYSVFRSGNELGLQQQFIKSLFCCVT